MIGRRHTAVLLLLGACLDTRASAEDSATLVRRAEVRLAHGNQEGAKALLQEALRQDPSCGPAIALLAPLHEDPTGIRLRYLLHGEPLDEQVAARMLTDLEPWIVDLPDPLYLQAERAALLPIETAPQVAGPWRPWEVAEAGPPPVLPAGPLRCEAYGTPAEQRLEAFRQVVERFEQEGVINPVAWARLAVVLETLREPDAAARALSRARPATFEEEAIVARAALLLAGDRLAWWRDNGPQLLARAPVCAWGTPEHEALTDLIEPALMGFVTSGDFDGALSIVEARSARRPIGGALCEIEVFAAFVRCYWSLHEACVRLEARRDATRDCARAFLLREMLQDDRAMELLQEVLHSSPDCALAWESWYRCATESMLLSKRREAAEHLLRISLARSVPLSPSFLRNLLQIDLQTEGATRTAARTITILARGVNETGLKSLIDFWYTNASRETPYCDLRDAFRQFQSPRSELVESMVSLALDRGRVEDLPELVTLLKRERARVCGEETARSLGAGESFGSMKSLLRCFSSQTAFLPMHDMFVRALLGAHEPPARMPLWLVRARQDLSADESFMRTPAGPYLCSLLCDQLFEAERAARFRALAFSQGCRAPGLLLDMALHGDDVLDDLAAVDPVAARFASAMRTEGAAELERFLEVDDAAEDLRERAVAEWRHRLGMGVAGEDTADPSDLPGAAGEVRRLWRAISMPSATTWSRVASASQQLPNPLLAALPRSSTTGQAWPHSFAQVRTMLPEELCARFREPGGPARAQELARTLAGSRSPNMESALRTLAAEQPLDLRWVHAIQDLAGGPWRGQFREAVWVALAPFRMCNAAFHAQGIESCYDEARRSEAMRRYFELRNGDPLAVVLCDATGRFWGEGHAALVQEAIQILKTRSLSDEDRDWLSWFARAHGLQNEFEELDEVLLESTDPAIRAAAVERDRERKGIEMEPEEVRTLSARGDASAEELRSAWRKLAGRAVADGDGDLLAEALQADWDLGSPWDLETIPAENSKVRSLLRPHLDCVEPPVSLCYYACVAAVYTRGGDELAARLAPRLHEAGIWVFDEWTTTLRQAPAGEGLRRFRELLRRRPAPQTRWMGTDLAVSAARERMEAGFRQEGVACIDEWAAWLGPYDTTGGQPQYVGDILGTNGGYPSPFGLPDGVIPPEGHAARALKELELWDEAIDRYRIVESSTSNAAIRDACHLAMAEVEQKRERPAAEAALLLCLLREAETSELRRIGYDRLCVLYDQCIDTHPVFVDALLAESATGRVAEDVATAAWEERLGSSSTADHDGAESALRDQGALATPLLAVLRRSSDPEVRARAEAILVDLANPRW